MQEQKRLGKEEKEWKYWPFGVCRVNAAMNLRSSRSRDGLSPYQLFFVQKIRSKFKHAFSIVSDAAKTEWGLESLRLFASVMRTNGVNPSKEESLDAIRIGDTYFSVNLKVEDDELNDIPIFTQMKDEVFQNMRNGCRKGKGSKKGQKEEKMCNSKKRKNKKGARKQKKQQ